MTYFEFEMNIKRKLREMNKTEKDVAKEPGISQAYLSQILRGKRKSVKIREKIDKLFKKEGKNE